LPEWCNQPTHARSINQNTVRRLHPLGFLRDPNTKAPPINLQIPPFLRKPLLTNFKISNSR
jgi:hypothetical protein